MDKRSTIVLAAIAIGLFAYIVLYERYTITSGELAEVEGQLIERFVRARVNRLVIERPGSARLCSGEPISGACPPPEEPTRREGTK